MIFEWDPVKARENFRKHDITFEEASSVFGDPLSITIPEPQVTRSEYRFVTIGISSRGRLLVVIHTDRYDRIRIISARKSTSRERKQYEQG